jgi:hypothetical protein
MPLIQPITTASGTSAFVPLIRTLTINGVTYDLSTDRTWTISGLGGLNATAPLSFNSGTSTISISQAGNSTDGYLSSADWLTFSSKQPAITLTTTGNSGASTFNVITGALNIPEYTLAGLGGFANPMTSLGDLIYANSLGAAVRRSGNTSTTKMYLSQTGDGTNSAAPQWSAISVGEVSGAVSGLTGEVSTTGSGTLNVTLGTTAVTGKLLTGLSITSGAITSSDSILSAFGKVQGQINGLAGGSTYKGSWNASTNTPTIVSGTGTAGDYYIVAVAGTTTIDGVSSWDIGDWIIFSGTVWQKIDNTDSVISVNGQVGSVVLTTSNITEGSNLYYTDARARASITLTTTGTSGAATYSSGVLNVPNYTLSGLGGISGSGTTNYIPKFTSSTAIGNSLIYDNGTNVGINNSNPNHKLDILTTPKTSITDIGSSINVDYNSSTNNNFQTIGFSWASSIGNSTTLWGMGFKGTNFSSGTGDVFLYTGGVQRLTVNNSGSVGIGTPSPAANLHVNGTFISSYLWTDALGNSFWGSYTTKYGGLTWDAGYARVFSHTSNALYLGAGGITATHLSIATTGQIKFNNYTSSTSFSGTVAGLLAFDSSGNIITTAGFVATSRTLTINGTTYDLTADRSWSVGTVTSVALTVPTGLSVTGSPITSSGTLAISLTAGYSIPTTLSQSNWDLAFNDKINSASVTGTTTKTLTLTQQDGGTITASWSDLNTDAVTSVNGLTGTVILTTSNISEGTNLYYTEARVNANANVAANTAARHNAVTLGTANGLSLSTQQLSLGLASSSTTGALSSTDWTTFNNKQNTLTNPITGTGTINYIPKFSGSTTLTNSLLSEGSNFVNIGENGSASEYSLQIGFGRSGNGYAYIDLIGDTTHTDYGMRLIRNNGGANTSSVIEHRGTGDFIFKGVDASSIKLQTSSTDRMIIDSAGRVGIGVSPTYTLQVNGSGYFSDNVRFPNTKGIVLENVSGVATGSIKMGNSVTNNLEITNGTNTIYLVTIGTVISSNLLVGASTIGTSATNTIAVVNGTAPSSSATDIFHLYSQDVTSGNAAPHFRTENGAIIKLYQETTSVGNAIFSQGGGNSVLDDSTFDGYTLRQIVKALRNQGILA